MAKAFNFWYWACFGCRYLKLNQFNSPLPHARNGILPKVPTRTDLRNCAAASEGPTDADGDLCLPPLQPDLGLLVDTRNR
jgi:hypothetical protein